VLVRPDQDLYVRRRRRTDGGLVDSTRIAYRSIHIIDPRNSPGPAGTHRRLQGAAPIR
jgi:hypothetical protein